MSSLDGKPEGVVALGGGGAAALLLAPLFAVALDCRLDRRLVEGDGGGGEGVRADEEQQQRNSCPPGFEELQKKVRFEEVKPRKQKRAQSTEEPKKV